MKTSDTVSITASLMRIRFLPEGSHDAKILAKFPDPQPSCAVATPLSMETMNHPGPDAMAAELLVLDISSGSNDLGHWREQAEAWIQPPAHDQTKVIRVNIEGGSLLWGPGRAVIQCSPERMRGVSVVLAEFVYYELELRRLEAEVSADWHALESHASLAQDVRRKDLKRSAELAEASTRTVSRRIRLSRIESRLLSPSTTLTESDVHLGQRLREEADVERRLETLDGQLETYETIYESANQRMGEYRNFRSEYFIEILILFVLLIETALIVGELYLYYVRGE
jgi:hypothetical protein